MCVLVQWHNFRLFILLFLNVLFFVIYLNLSDFEFMNVSNQKMALSYKRLRTGVSGS